MTDLPPLPEPYTHQVIEYRGVALNRLDTFPFYTVDHMRAYGAACAAAERQAYLDEQYKNNRFT